MRKRTGIKMYIRAGMVIPALLCIYICTSNLSSSCICLASGQATMSLRAQIHNGNWAKIEPYHRILFLHKDGDRFFNSIDGSSTAPSKITYDLDGHNMEHIIL